MTLLEYVISKEEAHHKDIVGRHGYESMEEYIYNECCPSKFKCIENTPYDIPYTKDKHSDYCKYNLEPNQAKCNECWNRTILI